LESLFVIAELEFVGKICLDNFTKKI